MVMTKLRLLSATILVEMTQPYQGQKAAAFSCIHIVFDLPKHIGNIKSNTQYRINDLRRNNYGILDPFLVKYHKRRGKIWVAYGLPNDTESHFLYHQGNTIFLQNKSDYSQFML